uniref:Uncharacterized protein n=1 Tax=Oryza barthii TaxID=65489 RepID=A0A0D3F9T4_9ORYZ
MRASRRWRRASPRRRRRAPPPWTPTPTRAAQPRRVGGRGQLRDAHGPRHAGDAVRDGRGHGLLAHLAAVLAVPRVVPPAVRPGVQPQVVEHLRLRGVLRAAVQRPPLRHAQPVGLLLLQRLHLPGQLRRQLLLRRLPQQGHRLVRLDVAAKLLLRLWPGQRGVVRPIRRAHRPRPQQALAPVPARAKPWLLLHLLPPVVVVIGVPVARVVQPGAILVHADGVQLARRLALLHQAVRDDGRRESAVRVVVGVLQPADDHRLRHGDHAPADERVLGAEQGGGGGHEGDVPRVGVLHPRHVLQGPGLAGERAGGHHVLRRRRGAQAVGAEPPRRRRRLHHVPGVRAGQERRHHREHAAADVQRRLRRQEQQDRVRRRRLQLRTPRAPPNAHPGMVRMDTWVN